MGRRVVHPVSRGEVDNADSVMAEKTGRTLPVTGVPHVEVIRVVALEVCEAVLEKAGYLVLVTKTDGRRDILI